MTKRQNAVVMAISLFFDGVAATFALMDANWWLFTVFVSLAIYAGVDLYRGTKND